MTILRRFDHQVEAPRGPDESWRARDVPVVPIAGNNLVMIAIVAGPRVEHYNGAGIEIWAFPRVDCKVRRGVAAWHIKQTLFGVESVRGPGRTTGDGRALRCAPARTVKG